MYFGNSSMFYLILIMVAGAFAAWASSKVKSTYSKYSKQMSKSGISAEVACRQVLDAKGLQHIKIERIAGNLTDHFSPKENIIRLSDAVYGNSSTAAIGVACHEAGHAMQYAEEYLPIKLRNAIIPVTNLGSKLSMPLIIFGLLLGQSSPKLIGLAYFGVLLFSLMSLFQIFTLPTEFNASSRALNVIGEHQILSQEEMSASKKVLDAAALTYVAALAVSLAQLLRLFAIVSGSRRRN
ncbi:MAG: zinc metallopeptidase [Anaerorhabdus sp.]